MNQYDPIQNKLKQYSVQVDKEKLWANTSHAVPRKRRRRGFLYLTFGLLSVALATLLLTWPSQDTKPSLAGEEAKPQVALSSGTPVAETPIPSTHDSNTDHQTTSSQVISNTTPSIGTTPSPKGHNPQNTMPASKNQAGRPGEGINISSGTHDDLSSKPNTADSGANSDQQSVGDRNEKTNNEPVIIPEMSSPAVTPLTIPSSSAQETTTALRASQWSTGPVDELTLNTLDITERVTDMSSISPAIVPASSGIPLSILLVQGVGFSTLNITAEDPALDALANTLSAQTMSLEQIYTSLHTLTPIGSIFQLSTGFQYSRLTTELSQTTSTSEDYTTEGITSIIIGEDGQVENLYGNVNVHREVYTHSTRYSYQHKLDLELMLNAIIIQSPRWASGLWMKGSYNLLYSSDGTTLGTERQLLPYTSADNPFRLKSPFGYGMGVNTTYKITPSWAILGKIGYERLVYTHGVFDDRLIYKHNIFNLGLGTSLSF